MAKWMLMFFLVFISNLNGEVTDMRITSSAFNENGSIPSKYTCDGENISPPLHWDGAPAGTKSFVLIVDDPDAPSKVWTHWVVYNISPTTTECKEGAAPAGSSQGVNDFGKAKYGGPCPPSGTHHYFFKLYALDTTLPLTQGATKQQVEKEIKPHVLGETRLIGTYHRQ
jgi:Raf kinase inhibitor-like YbhB/YbcL family protein